MAERVMYIELKTGYADNGPAWIGRVKTSKSGQTIYFNGKAFKKCHGISGNYYDIETEEEYWISGVKKDGADRHWAGGGKIFIDHAVVDEYLALVGTSKLDKQSYEIISLENDYPIDRIYEKLNG